MCIIWVVGIPYSGRRWSTELLRKVYATYMGVYEYLARGSYTTAEITKHLANDMNPKTAQKHCQKAAEGGLDFISLNKDEKLELDKSALIGFLLEFCKALHLHHKLNGSCFKQELFLYGTKGSAVKFVYKLCCNTRSLMLKCLQERRRHYAEYKTDFRSSELYQCC